MLDGGLSTALEGLGCDSGGALWTTEALLEQPHVLQRAHESFVASGIDLLSTATYQLSELSLSRAGMESSPEMIGDLLRRSVRIARRAGQVAQPDERRPDRQPGVALSLGPFGAALADGSEYHGDYGVSIAELERFHGERLRAARWSGADCLLIETVPSLDEIRGLESVLETLSLEVPVWVSMSLRSSGELADGSALTEAAGVISRAPIAALGVNCIAPEIVAGALEILGSVSDVPLIAYPNSGRVWDATLRRWDGEGRRLRDFVEDWIDAGVSAVGGCCGVGPAEIADLVSRVEEIGLRERPGVRGD